MSGKILSVTETRYTAEVQLEWEGKKERVSLLKEDAEALALPPCPAALSSELYDSLKDKESREKAVKQALQLLTKATYSKQRLYEKLKAKGFCKEHAILGVYMAVQYGYLREEEQISQILLQMAEQAYGPLRAMDKLEKAGYGQKTIARVMARLAEEGQLDFALAKKRRMQQLLQEGVPSEKAKSKLYYYGFGEEAW